ncbi:MAG: response regulator transcription factor [Cystobacterineae bacterium]|nr:response regulator transcription factor [Cystobacterineae bacterium]
MPENASSRKINVYVVEDSPQLLKGLLKALDSWPEMRCVGCAMHSETALKEMLKLDIDVVLMDLELPGMDGVSLTRELKQRRLPLEVLVLTTFDEEERVFEAIKAGALGYLVKRVGLEKVRSAVKEVFNGGVVIETLIARRFWNYFSAVQASAHLAQNPWGLNTDELNVLELISKGLSNAEIGGVLQIQSRTVRTHLGHIYKKMGVNSHVDAVVLALRAGAIQL